MRHAWIVVSLLMIGILAGCDTGAPIAAEPVDSWSTSACSPARNTYVASADFSQQPVLVWDRAIPTQQGHEVSTLLADSGRLYALCEIRQHPRPHLGRERIYMLGIALKDGEELWKYDNKDLVMYEQSSLMDTGARTKGPAILQNDALHLATETGLLILDAATGAQKRHHRKEWAYRYLGGREGVTVFRLPRAMVVGQTGQRAYLLSREGKVTCLDLDSGSSLWEATAIALDENGWPRIVLALQGTTLVAVAGDEKPATMTALSTDGGGILWQRGFPRVTLFSGPAFPVRISIAGNSVLALAVQGSPWSWRWIDAAFVSVFDLASGRLRRNIRFGLSGSVCSDGLRAWLSVAPAGGIICVDLASGRKLWRSNDPIGSQPIIVNGAIIFLCEDGVVRALSPADGSRLWEVRAGAADAGLRSLLVVGDYIVAWGKRHVAVLASSNGPGRAERLHPVSERTPSPQPTGVARAGGR